MSLIGGVLAFAAGALTTYVVVPEIKDDVHSIAKDSKLILDSKEAIQRRCYEKILKWHNEGILEDVIQALIDNAAENHRRLEELNRSIASRSTQINPQYPPIPNQPNTVNLFQPQPPMIQS